MFKPLKTLILTQMEEIIREVDYGCRVVEKDIPSLYKQEEED